MPSLWFWKEILVDVAKSCHYFHIFKGLSVSVIFLQLFTQYKLQEQLKVLVGNVSAYKEGEILWRYVG